MHIQSHSNHPCVVCDSPYVLHVNSVECQPNSIEEKVDIFFCMNCESCQSPNAEPKVNGGGALSWHKKVLARNLGWSRELIDLLVKKNYLKSHIVDIGCGSGALLAAGRELGIQGIGFDTDVEAVEFFRRELSVDLRGETWSPTKTAESKFDLITSISLLEHLHFPGQLIKEMSDAAKEKSANIFVSVPLFNKNKWSRMWEIGYPPGPPADTHVTHFSDKGLITAFRKNGATHFEKLTAGGWIGFIIQF
ncbi:MAG: class I SAM-dependent methyltransferase [Halioglobus sp.]